MEDNKISHSFLTFIVWVLTILSWTIDHIGAIAGIAAVTASFFSIRASRATERLRHRQFEERLKPSSPPVTSRDSEEPDTDT